MHSLLMPVIALAESGEFNPLDVANGGGFLWTLIIFAVSAPFIWMIVMGPVTKALEERDSKAVRAIEAAEKASSAAETARAEVEVKLGEARAEAAGLLAEARDRGAERERQIVEAAKKSASETLDTARKAIQAEQDKALAAIRSEVVDLALSGASKVLGRNVGSEDDRRLVSDLVAESKGSSSPAQG